MIIGAGPAGLAAAVYAARKRLNTLLVSADIGGQINNTWGIENYLGYQFIEGPELIGKFQTQVAQFPIDQKIGAKVERLVKTASGLEAVTEAGERYQARAVIFATGKRPRKLNVPGEKELTGCHLLRYLRWSRFCRSAGGHRGWGQLGSRCGAGYGENCRACRPGVANAVDR